MKLRFGVPAAVLACLMVLPAAEKISPKDLPGPHRKWLQEEVVYIISPKEREVFLQLKTNRERDLFIEAFWKQRDPTPGSAENEFKKDRYERIAYANHYFGREATGAGWRTDMGRIFIILGPPKDIETSEGQGRLYATQVKRYEYLCWQSGTGSDGKRPSGSLPGLRRSRDRVGHQGQVVGRLTWFRFCRNAQQGRG